MKELTNDEICREVLIQSNSVKRSFIDFVLSFPFQAIAIGCVYLVGRFNISSVWLLGPLILSVMRDKWKAERDLEMHVSIVTANKEENILILEHIDRFPPWIVFPDMEQCEWLNKVISHLWPYCSCYLTKLLEEELERNMKKGFPTVKFNRISFGSVPPRVSGVKVYEKIMNPNEIMVDMNLYYAGDCEFSFVVLALSGGIKNLQVRGYVRLIMKPLLKRVPLVGGLEVYFLRKPKVDFDLVGVVELLNLPGLSGRIREILDDQISSMMVIPNKKYFSWSDNINGAKVNVPDPVGVLRVNVINAKDLTEIDTGLFQRENINSYVTVNVGTKTFSSEPVDEQVVPKWDFWAEFIIDFLYRETLVITVFKGDYNVGTISLEVNTIKQEGNIDKWMQLENVETGDIHLCVSYYELSSNQGDYCCQSNQLPLLSSCIFLLYIDTVQNLFNHGSEQKPSVAALITVGNSSQTSKTVTYSDNPVFQQNFTFLVNNPELEKVRVCFLDKNLNNSSEIGNFSFKLRHILASENMEILNQRHPILDTASEASVVLSMKLLLLKGIEQKS